MAFKKAPPPQNVPDSPEKLLLELPRRKIPGVLLHQGEIMRAYMKQAIDAHDVALQLPTGSGKTLVGLMIAEWRRRKFNERVLYLCPTRQLVNQVVEQADEQYGLVVNGFTGSVRNYDPTEKAQYQNADRVAITTYSSLFNTNPFFDNPEIIIVDDAHAAENYITELWTIKVDRGETTHKALHTAIANLLKPYLEPRNFALLMGDSQSIADTTWVDKLPSPTLYEIKEQLCAILDAHSSSTDLQFAWSMVRNHISGCQLYLSSHEILIRPLIPPTWSHQPFDSAKQRIFMSATLGAGGDLERLTGRKSIQRLPVPEGWDKQGIGRRFFVFPSLSLKDDQVSILRRELIALAGRSLILVPGERQRIEVTNDVKDHLKFKIFDAENIEKSKKPFVESKNAIAVIANRYDGIDFPGEDCRLLFIDGLPRATNAQERFLMSRMGANILFNERVQTRVLQAIGRCTRSLQDYSAVVVTGEHLPDYLVDRKRREHFHPELQAELEFGIEQSQETSVEDIIENFKIFLENGADWEDANSQILDKRSRAEQAPFPAMEDLMSVVGYEIEFQKRMWQGDSEKAMEAAEHILASLSAPELKGYRALWHYLAGSAAWQLGQDGSQPHTLKSSEHFKRAKEAAPNIPWLVSLSKYQSSCKVSDQDHENIILLKQIERLEGVLTDLGTIHSRKYDNREKEILEGLRDADKFENAHKLLGEILGFDAGKEESDASPDPWWIVDDLCFVFEDHAGAHSNSVLDATKARQAATHPNWIKRNLSVSAECRIISVLVSPVCKTAKGAVPHLNGFYYWNLVEFVRWAENALATIRELRIKFVESGDLMWRAEACSAFTREGIDGTSIYSHLLKNKASEKLNS